MSRPRNNESGQAVVLALGLALVVFAVAGLAVDGTRAFLLRRALQNAADAAALGGSGELDRDVYYAGDGVALDEGEARGVAIGMLSTRGIEGQVEVDVTPTTVRLVLRGEAPTIFLGLVGISEIPVAVEATAVPAQGSPGG